MQFKHLEQLIIGIRYFLMHHKAIDLDLRVLFTFESCKSLEDMMKMEKCKIIRGRLMEYIGKKLDNHTNKI